MARNLKHKGKIVRTFGENIFETDKFTKILSRRNFPAGQHGPTKKHHKVSGYGKQLKEKQKVKYIYGLLERQFSNYVAEASKKTGDTSKFLLTYLESRLDNVVFRMGLASTRSAARQMVSHGHVTVNGKKVNIPSYRVKVGEVIGVKETSRKRPLFAQTSEAMGKKDVPGWLSIDPSALTGKILNVPSLDHPNFDANMIIGFYSR